MWCNQLVIRLAALLLKLPGIAVDQHQQVVQHLVREHLGLEPAWSPGGTQQPVTEGGSSSTKDRAAATGSSGAGSLDDSCHQAMPQYAADQATVIQGSLVSPPEPGVQLNIRQVVQTSTEVHDIVALA